MTYAAGTDVPVERSKAELEKLLRKYGAGKFMSGWDEGSRQIGVMFRMGDRAVKIVMPIPSKDEPAVARTPSGKYIRSPEEQARAWQALIRQRWRALVLIMKAKLEAVQAGVTSFEKEFLGDLVLPSGATVADVLLPEMDRNGGERIVHALGSGGHEE
jgi:hypothetical protein